ncbi:MAG: hypothetical protein RIQ81_82 [Pseudomonadota bacterium]|jgi:acyl-CoA thioesterase FadM
MNKFFRFCWTIIVAFFRKYTGGSVGILDSCTTPFIVLPNDLDTNLHMNNGVFFSIQDLARTDFIIRSGVVPALRRNGWYPVVLSETLHFRRELRLFQRFVIKTRIACWDERDVYIEHRFESGGELCAVGVIKARFLKKSGGHVRPTEINAVAGEGRPSPAMPEHIALWQQGDHMHWKTAKGQ